MGQCSRNIVSQAFDSIVAFLPRISFGMAPKELDMVKFTMELGIKKDFVTVRPTLQFLLDLTALCFEVGL